MSTSSFNLARLRSQIKPFRLHWFSRLRSTNDHAARLRKRGELFAPAIVLTGNQIAGRGRNSNTWWSGPGSLTVTFVLPVDEQLQSHQLALIAGLAVRNAAAQLTEQQTIKLKWPNDVVWQDRKLAGLLCERVHKADVIGVGLNVNDDPTAPPALRRRLVCLSEIANRQLDKTDVLVAIAQQLYRTLSRRSDNPFPAVLGEYNRHHVLRGRRVTVQCSADQPPIRGTCQGVDSMGRLLVRSGRRMHRVVAGQVQIR